ncbi:hypothetical protein DFH09DRAFT_1282329 [Mycena vulgaris]|nr:hypothetical protein DFH09DRAFT_1282329 [Mycena vulgaris]
MSSAFLLFSVAFACSRFRIRCCVVPFRSSRSRACIIASRIPLKPLSPAAEVEVKKYSRCTPAVPAIVLLSGLFRSPAITPSQAPLILPVLPSSELESQNFLLLTLVPMGFPDPRYFQAPQITVVKSNVLPTAKIQNERRAITIHVQTQAECEEFQIHGRPQMR